MIEGRIRVTCGPPAFISNDILQNSKYVGLAPVTRNLSLVHHHFVADEVFMQ